MPEPGPSGCTVDSCSLYPARAAELSAKRRVAPRAASVAAITAAESRSSRKFGTRANLTPVDFELDTRFLAFELDLEFQIQSLSPSTSCQGYVVSELRPDPFPCACP